VLVGNGVAGGCSQALFEAVAQANEALYERAIEYNRPMRSGNTGRPSALQRLRPGVEVTKPAVIAADAVGSASALERLMASNFSRPSRRLQPGMRKRLDEANEWAGAVTRLHDGVRASLGSDQGLGECRVVTSGSPGKPGRAKLTSLLGVRQSINVRGIMRGEP
jgi:hypothetical protein